MSEPSKTVFIHVGCRKTGTSHLQFGLQRSQRRLARAGLHQPLGARGGTMQGLLLPLQAATKGDPGTAERAVADLARSIRDREHPRHLISLEALAELAPEATTPLVAGLSEFDTHLIITARSWGHTIPSEWQQRIKSRFTGDYLDYVEAIRSPETASDELADEAAAFRRRQDVADVVRRWRAADPDLPVTVILVPAVGGEGTSLVDMFCALISVAPEDLNFPKKVTNESLSHTDAELLRRVNVALGERLGNPRGPYRHHVRKWIVMGSMMKRSRAKIRLPRALEAWCEAESGRQLAELEELGVQVLGDPDTYLRPRLPGDDFVPASTEDLLENAASVLADLADRHVRETKRWKREVRRAGRAAEASPDDTDTHVRTGSPAQRVRTMARRVRRRLTRPARKSGA